MAVCGKVDTYGAPWMEKQCRCPGAAQCSTSSHAHDGHTVHDRNKQYKVRHSGVKGSGESTRTCKQGLLLEVSFS